MYIQYQRFAITQSQYPSFHRVRGLIVPMGFFIFPTTYIIEDYLHKQRHKCLYSGYCVFFILTNYRMSNRAKQNPTKQIQVRCRNFAALRRLPIGRERTVNTICQKERVIIFWHLDLNTKSYFPRLRFAASTGVHDSQSGGSGKNHFQYDSKFIH